MGDSRDKRFDLILQQLQQLPTLPAVAVRVLEATGADDSSAREVVELISSDPSLTTRILQLVHRADQGVSAGVATVERAVVLLGFDAVRCAVLAVSVFETFDPHGSPGSRFNREEFWKHCIGVACCAELLAEASARTGTPAGERVRPSDAFVCGLLHDLGKIALDTVLPKSYDRIVEAADLLHGNIADVERNVIGLDHMVVGKRLAEQWQLPALVRDAIWLHGQSPEALPASVRSAQLVNLITLADLMVREQHLGYSGNHVFPLSRPQLLQASGISEQAAHDAQQRLLERIQQRATALGLGSASSGELYMAALTRANRELGRVSEQLAARNRRLAVRARFFDALSQFQGELRPDGAPSLVLQAIGQTAAGILQAAPVAVFSCHGGEAVAEMAIVDEQGELIGTGVLECPSRIAKPNPGEGPVLRVGAELEWLLEAASPRLSGDQRFWICLEAEGACIGGVVWGAKAGEAQRLSAQAQELTALGAGWSLALRTAQIREESRTLAEQLAESNRQLQSIQSELLRSRTLASVGEMAAGAAHEMNNPLAVISGRAQLLASQLDDTKLKHAATTIFEQSHRLSQIITDLMEFAKPDPPRAGATDLADLLERALYETKSQCDPGSRRIELTMSELPPVVVDGRQIQAAFLQILHNALQATDEKDGQVLIHAAYDAFSSRVVVTVADNGRGMDDQTLRRAFDPFFSSQPAGRRRGMGLAKALRWVEASGGSIRLESHPQQGTRATVILPAAWPVAGDDPAASATSVAEG